MDIIPLDVDGPGSVCWGFQADAPTMWIACVHASPRW
jgi:hypothetical protein